MAKNIVYTATQLASQGTPAFATGKVVFDGTAIVAADYVEIYCGFKPKYVSFQNLTDRIGVEFYEGMTDNNCLKTAATGARTLETANGGITLTNTGFRVTQNATLAVIAASKTCVWKAAA